MGSKSRTTTKSTRKATTASNGRSKELAVVSKAAAFMSETKMGPTTALRRAGVTSAAAVKRLTKVLKDRELDLKCAGRLEKKRKAVAATRSKSKPERASAVASRASTRQGQAKAARTIAIVNSRNQEKITHTPTSGLPVDSAVRLPVAHGIIELADASPAVSRKSADLVPTFNGNQMNLLSAMFYFSPVGMMLRQTAAVGRLFRRPDGPSRPYA